LRIWSRVLCLGCIRRTHVTRLSSCTADQPISRVIRCTARRRAGDHRRFHGGRLNAQSALHRSRNASRVSSSGISHPHCHLYHPRDPRISSELATWIRVNVVSPGPISTPIYGKLGLPREALEAFAENIVVGNKSWSMLLTLTESQMPVNVEGRKKSMLR